ncbi:L,D-transpeptidase family protein [Zooshikella marina]|uniref:L,D-transpeptidase n=1 Tax=Zooshikella ganghwensis TaxID=202772 RepID=A0A4P9VMI0_9GAMM|nr:L,D-transpeptidase family protein [Zooshikella ganghwensis]MBU2706950.1 L,D-transpeptidase family protein [Zooshikella ganghwensis]RDH44553.1 L,D-transpeptidase [Zooshikella ganghwensis]
MNEVSMLVKIFRYTVSKCHAWFLCGITILSFSQSWAAVYPLPSNGDNVVGYIRQVSTAYEDTFMEISRREGLGFLTVRAANPEIDPWLPGEGVLVTLPTQMILPPVKREGIVINLAELRLYYFPPNEDVVVVFPVGIGRRGWQTPEGKTHIMQKIENPTWTPPASIRREHAEKGDILPAVVPAGPDNPLGLFALRLGNGGSYLIHGTNRKYGVGMRVSHGCIRLFPDHIEQLFAQVSRGTPVKIIHESYKIGRLNGEIYIESHEPLSERVNTVRKPAKQVLSSLLDKMPEASTAINRSAALDAIQQETGLPQRVSLSSVYVKDLF